MSLESLIDKIIDLQFHYSGSLRNSFEHRKELKYLLCREFEEHCDDIYSVLDKYSKEWKETKGNNYNFNGPPAETPLVDRIIDLIINKTKNDLNNMEKNFRKECGLEVDE